jgi:dihydrofolate synthase/folylpolyglutamate synthase
MSYEEMLRRLLALRRFGMRPGLGGVRALLERLGRPEAGLAVVHVGGTNGKGSTVALIEATLRAAGRKTGMYTSPHLLRFTERIRIDGEELAGDAAAALAERVLAASGEGTHGDGGDGDGEATFFEVVTAMAFLAFAERGVDVAVVEVGLGGRLDATNVIERPLATVVTSIGLDHMDVLGATLTAIAREKAGIWKPGVPAIFACADAEARAVLAAEAARVGAPAAILGRDFDDAGLPPLALAGAHQRRNAALARRALAALPERLRPTEAALAAGFGGVRWPGRMEQLTPTVLVDAAHNEEGAQALAAALPAGPFTLVLGVVADKDPRAVAGVLAPRAARVIATAPPTPRALPAAALAEVVRALAPGVAVESAPELAAALRAAQGDGGGDARVVVAGSIFLVGEARRLLLGERADPLAVQDPVGQKL